MHQRIVTHAYNADWQKKSQEAGRLDWQRRALRAFSMFFNEILHAPLAGEVLDVGCGDGMLVQALNQRAGVHARGIDIADGINFEVDALPYQENEFDVAVLYSVIEHLRDAGNLLHELQRVLRPKGIAVVITPHFDLARPLICDRHFYDDPTHIHPYNRVSLEHIMRLYHFQACFVGLWTVRETAILWKLPAMLQFSIGALLPFTGSNVWAPAWLRGRSKTMLCAFTNGK